MQKKTAFKRFRIQHKLRTVDIATMAGISWRQAHRWDAGVAPSARYLGALLAGLKARGIETTIEGLVGR